MVLTKDELISLLQQEIRILLHLAGKVDRAKLDYRPTSTQRSTIELIQYLAVMGPTQLAVIKGRGVRPSDLDGGLGSGDGTRERAGFRTGGSRDRAIERGVCAGVGGLGGGGFPEDGGCVWKACVARRVSGESGCGGARGVPDAVVLLPEGVWAGRVGDG
jgi:hypothetical protein